VVCVLRRVQSTREQREQRERCRSLRRPLPPTLGYLEYLLALLNALLGTQPPPPPSPDHRGVTTARLNAWIATHIHTFVSFSPLLLGAVNPTRSVLSGENMGLPMSDNEAREVELTFGSTSTPSTISRSNAPNFAGKRD